MEKNKSFWDLFHEVRKERLPVKSAVYDLSEKFYIEQRKEHDLKWKSHFDYQIHPSYVQFYNEIYSRVHDLANTILISSHASQEAKNHANKTFGFRLENGATVKDLLVTDVFGDKTINLDIPVPLVANELEDKMKTDFGFLLNSYHYTLHWPQSTEFLFLHELIVGYLGNLIQHKGELPDRGTIPIIGKSYWTIPAYVLRELAIFLQRSEADVVALHFETNERVREALPKSIQDLLLISAHLTLYIEHNNNCVPTRSNANMLALVYMGFFLPTLERLALNPSLKLRDDAGIFTDQILCHFLLGLGVDAFQPPTENILRHMLLRFADELWV